MGQFFKKHLEGIQLAAEGVDWAKRDLSYLIRDEYEQRFSRWLAEAKPVMSVGAARQVVGGGGDLKVRYHDKKELENMCKGLGLMEDLKAGVPRTGYHGVVLVRLNGRRLFLTPSYKVDQDITKRGATPR